MSVQKTTRPQMVMTPLEHPPDDEESVAEVTPSVSEEKQVIVGPHFNKPLLELEKTIHLKGPFCTKDNKKMHSIQET